MTSDTFHDEYHIQKVMRYVEEAVFLQYQGLLFLLLWVQRVLAACGMCIVLEYVPNNVPRL